MKDICDKGMTFQDCELAILRAAVDIAETRQGKKTASSPEIKRIITIVEGFLKKKSLVCYGGTAINNILPKQDQFYNKDVEIPDYDFYSPNALNDAKSLVDDYIAQGFIEVEAKSGQHHGTYKVFVNFIPVADISYIPKELFNAVKKDAVMVASILYAPPNFLRMSMYLELSRPAGDTSRWEKVMKRLNLLNESHPMKSEYNCAAVEFQRKMDNDKSDGENIYTIVRDTFIDLGVVFFGGYAFSLYSRKMPKKEQQFIQKIPDFDVLSEDIEKTALIIEERLRDANFKDITQIHHDAIGEIIPEHIEIQYKKETMAFIYKPMACHNYNTIQINDMDVNVATIDTIMSFYLAFLYAGTDYYFKDRILCMAKYLFELEQKNRLSQDGVLKRFTSKCMGTQETLESIRAKKSKKYESLRGKRGTEEYEKFFLRYSPSDNAKKKIDTEKKPEKKSEKKSEKKTEKKSEPFKLPAFM